MSMASKAFTEIRIRRVLGKRSASKVALAGLEAAKEECVYLKRFNEKDDSEIAMTIAEFDEDIKNLNARIEKLDTKLEVLMDEYQSAQE